MNIRRLWAVVSPKTNEVIYTSFDYNRAKKAFDVMMADDHNEVGMPYPSIGQILGYQFCRFDLSPHYSFSDCVQKEVNKTVRDFLDFILMKSGDKNKNQKQQIEKDN